ncbi:MAG: type II secretion system F family protein [Treponemataceae bacterium]
MKNNLLNFTKNMNALLNSGVNIKRALNICGSVDKNLREACIEIKNGLDCGKSFYLSIEKCKSIKFPDMYKSFIMIAEKTSDMKSIFAKLSAYLENKEKNKEKIIQCLMYPLFICITTFCTGIFILVYIYPKFSLILAEFSLNDAKFSKVVREIRYSLIVFVAVFLLCFCIVIFIKIFASKNEKLRFYVDFFKLKIPVLNEYIMAVNCADFAFVMNILCGKGISIVEGMKSALISIENSCLKQDVKFLQEELNEGLDLSEAFEKTKFFPEYFVMWMKISRQTGNIGESFCQVESFFKYESEKKLQYLLNALEPSFVCIAGIFVLFLVIKFVLPIFNILEGAI